MTPREQQVLDLRAAGLSFPAIAAKLGIAIGTAQEYARNARQRQAALKAANSAAAKGYPAYTPGSTTAKRGDLTAEKIGTPAYEDSDSPGKISGAA